MGQWTGMLLKCCISFRKCNKNSVKLYYDEYKMPKIKRNRNFGAFIKLMLLCKLQEMAIIEGSAG